MSPSAPLSCRCVVVLALLVLCCAGERGWAQKPPPPGKPNPQAPVLNPPTPLGAQRGTTLELTLTGTNLADPTGLLVSFPVKITIPTDNKNGQDNTKLRVRLEIPADAPLGSHSLRLATTRGMSNLRLFCVDDLPQVLQVDTSRSKATPQALPVPCVVAGRLNAEASDWYKITVKPGQRLSFDVLGHRLGSPIDPELSLYHAKTGRKVAYENDSPGCQTDPRLTWTFKEGGDYLLEVNDTLHRGGPDYGYRLRIGDFPCATVPIPMAAKRGGKVTVQFAGPAVEGVAPVEVEVPADPAVNTVWVAPRGPSGLHGWPVALAVSNHDELVEQEPNNDPAKANRVPVPGGITGRFEQSDDVDFYVFAGKKGQKLLLEAHTLELYSPTLVYMAVKNAKTKAELAKSNPQSAPPADQRIEFTPTEDGDYLLEVQHLNFLGGPSEAYRVTLTPSVPGFDLSLAIERYDVAPGGVLSLPVLVTRRGYTGPIVVSVKGPPGISGEVTVPAGQPTKPGLPGATLVVKVGPEVRPGPYPIALEGKGTEKGTTVTEFANLRGVVSASLGGLPYPPRQLSTQIALAVKERPPFALAAAFDPPQGVPGMPVSVRITLQRDPGFDEAVTLLPPTGLPPGVTAGALKPIPKGQNEIMVPLTLTAKAPLGKFAVTFSGKAKQGAKEFVVSAPAALVLGAPFELKAEPAALKLAAGGKVKLKIVAIRKGGYQGPIAVEVRGLPAGVTAAKTAIPMGQSVVEVEVSAAANAAAASVKGVNVLGTATAAGNVQGASPNFVVSVTKK